MAIEGNFEKYASVVLGILGQAGNVTIDVDDDDQIDYVNTLRESILEAYTGIVQGMQDGNKQMVVASAIDGIINFVHRSTADEHCTISVLKGAVGLLGDLGSCYGNRMQQIYSQPFVAAVLSKSRQYEELQQLTQWAQGVRSLSYCSCRRHHYLHDIIGDQPGAYRQNAIGNLKSRG